MKRIPSPNYSLSIAMQENALRVTWLMPWTSGSAAADPRLLAAVRGHSCQQAPMARHIGCHLGATFGWRCPALEFSRGSREQPKLRRNLPEPAAKARAGLLVKFSRFTSFAHLNLTVFAPPNPEGAAAA